MANIIQIVDEISNKITGITTSVGKIKTSQANNKKKIIDDLRNIKEKIQAMKKSCEKKERKNTFSDEEMRILSQSLQEAQKLDNERGVRWKGGRKGGVEKKSGGSVIEDATKFTIHPSSVATGKPRGGGKTKQKKRVRKRRTHKKFRR